MSTRIGILSLTLLLAACSGGAETTDSRTLDAGSDNHDASTRDGADSSDDRDPVENPGDGGADAPSQGRDGDDDSQDVEGDRDSGGQDGGKAEKEPGGGDASEEGDGDSAAQGEDASDTSGDGDGDDASRDGEGAEGNGDGEGNEDKEGEQTGEQAPEDDDDEDDAQDEEDGEDGEDSAEGLDAGVPAADVLTYHRDLRPVIASNCLACHHSKGIAPFALETYEELAKGIDLVIPAVEDGDMPPWKANDDCHPIADSRRLDDDTRALFRQWRDDGMVEGDPDDFVMPAGPRSKAPLGPISQTFEMPDTYVPRRTLPGQEDEQRCFLLPGTIEAETYMRALQVTPTTRTVHHLQVHRIPADGVADAERREAAAEGAGYPCFGEAAPGSYNLFSWHPGAEIIQFGEDEAAFLSPGSRLALQVHFNSDGFGPEEELPPERTKVDLWLLPDGELPDYVVVRFFLSGGFFSLPPGDDSIDVEAATLMGWLGVEGSSSFIPGEFIGHTPHMHWLGVDFNVRIDRWNGERTCLIDVPSWDFDWQLDYFYPREAYVPFGAFDTVTVHCGYDNSAANQPVIQGVQQTPRQVYFGQSSTDEMCLNHTWVRYKREDYLRARPSQ